MDQENNVLIGPEDLPAGDDSLMTSWSGTFRKGKF